MASAPWDSAPDYVPKAAATKMPWDEAPDYRPDTTSAAGVGGTIEQTGAGMAHAYGIGSGMAVRGVGQFLEAPPENAAAFGRNARAGVANVAASVGDASQVETDAMGNPMGAAAPAFGDSDQAILDQRAASATRTAQETSDVATKARAAARRNGTFLGTTGGFLEDAGQAASDAHQLGMQRDAPIVGRQQQNVQDANGFVDTVKASVMNPLGTVATGVQSLPDMALGAAAGIGAGKLAGGLLASSATEAGESAFQSTLLKAASNPATLADASRLARAAQQEAVQKVMREGGESVAGKVGIATESAQSGLSNRQQVQDFVQNAKEEDLRKNDRYRELLQSNSPPEARNLLANELADYAQPGSVLATAAGGYASGVAGAEGKFLMGGKSTLAQGVKATGKEMLEEALQNPGENYAQYAAQVQADPSQKYDFGGSVAQGMMGGLVQGGGMHAIGHVGGGPKSETNVTLAGRPIDSYSDVALQRYVAADVLSSGTKQKVVDEIARRSELSQAEAAGGDANGSDQLGSAVQRYAEGEGASLAPQRAADGGPADARGGDGNIANTDGLGAGVRTDARTSQDAGRDGQSLPSRNAEQGGSLDEQRATAISEAQASSDERNASALSDVGAAGGLAAARAPAQQFLADRSSNFANQRGLEEGRAQIRGWAQKQEQAGLDFSRAPDLGEIADPKVKAAANAVADAMQAAFGTRPLMFHDARAGAPDGFAINGKSYVNAANLQQSIHFTAFHETWHVAEQRAGNGDVAAQQFIKAGHSIFDMMSNEGREAYAKKFLFANEISNTKSMTVKEALADPKLRSEMVGDFFGQRGEDIKFLRRLSQRDPGSFGGFVRTWVDSLTNIIAEFKAKRSLGVRSVDDYIKKLSHAKAIAASALIEWRRSNPTLSAQVPKAGMTLQSSAKTQLDPAHVLSPDVFAQAREVYDEVKSRPKGVGDPLTQEGRARAEAMLRQSLDRAEAIKPEFDRRVESIARTVGGDAHLASVKGIKRAAEKLVLDYDFKIGQMRDLLRASVIVPSLNDVPAALRGLGIQFHLEPGRLKDRFAKPMETGYRDVLANIIMPDGTLGEVQIHIPEIMAVKELGHAAYTAMRELSPQSSRFASLVDLQKQIYGQAYAKAHANSLALSAKNSDSETASPRANVSAELNGRFDGSNANASPDGSRTTGVPSTSKNLEPGSNFSDSSISQPRLGQRSATDDRGTAVKNAAGSDVGHKRTADGRYVGAPTWIGDSPEKLKVLRNQLRKLAKEGEPGRFWYEQSSRAILRLAGGDKKEAERIVGLIAIYSPNATVAANTSMALNAYFQYKAGMPIKAGLGAGNRKAEDLLRNNKAWSGIKTNSFYQNLMVEIDSSQLDKNVATMDMWMALAFDYGKKSLDQGPAYKFTETETSRLAKELGWTSHQVQAAIWTAIKARVESSAGPRKEHELATGIASMVTKIDPATNKPTTSHMIARGQEYAHFRAATRFGMEHTLDPQQIKDSKYDFSHALADREVQMSWEATPGASTGFLPGMLKAPIEQQFEYLVAVQKALTTHDGRDAIAQAVGVPEGVSVNGFSAWKGDTGAGAQTMLSVALDGSGHKRDFKPGAKLLLDAYAAARGLLLKQEAVVYHHPVYGVSEKRHNGVSLETNRPITEAEMKLLYGLLQDTFDTQELAPAYRPDGARILNFVEGLDNGKFQNGMDHVVAQLPDDFGGGLKNDQHGSFMSIGNYVSNDWARSPNGEEYKSQIAALSPDVQRRVAELQAGVDAVGQEFSRRYGWGSATGPSFSGKQSDDASGGRGRTVVEGPGGRVDISGVHYSNAARETLDGRKYGTGLRGAERGRLELSDDPRIKQRVYLYVDEGKGIRQESGVGGIAHSVQAKNLYDMSKNPLKISFADANAGESAILNAGFSGYYVPKVFNNQGVAVVMGEASHAIAATAINPPKAVERVPQVRFAYSSKQAEAASGVVKTESLQAGAKNAGENGGPLISGEIARRAPHEAFTMVGAGRDQPIRIDENHSVHIRQRHPEDYKYLAQLPELMKSPRAIVGGLPENRTMVILSPRNADGKPLSVWLQKGDIVKGIQTQRVLSIKTMYSMDDSLKELIDYSRLKDSKTWLPAKELSRVRELLGNGPVPTSAVPQESSQLSVPKPLSASGSLTRRSLFGPSTTVNVYGDAALAKYTSASNAGWQKLTEQVQVPVRTERLKDIDFSKKQTPAVNPRVDLPPEETKVQAFQRKAQDKFNRMDVIQRWAEAHGAKLTPAADVYRTEELMYGRMATRMEDFREKTLKPLVERVQAAGFTMEQIAKVLHAQHAEERNIQISKINPAMPDGGSGMKTADARSILSKTNPRLLALANQFQAITNQTRDILLKGGIINQDMANAWGNAYKHYVPLKGGDDERAVKTGSGPGLSVNGKQKRALGHVEREENIIENIMRDHERAIMTVEKNRVGQSMLIAATELNNPNIITVDKPVKRGVLMPKHEFEVRSKGMTLATFDKQSEALEWMRKRMLQKAPPRMTISKSVADQQVQYMASPQLAENEATVYVNGHTVRLQINDEILAREYKNLGVEQLNKVLTIGRSVQTYLSKAYTGYNPAFIARNAIRDFGSGTIKIGSNFGPKILASTWAKYPSAIKDLVAYSWTGKATKEIAEYRANGGSTGAAWLSDIERLGRDVTHTFEKYEGVMSQVRQGKKMAAARVASQKTIGALTGWIEHLNMATENAMRLALYNAIKASGGTIEEAASAAKNSTVNFNRKGEMGGVMSALYLFYNPNVQDTASVIQSLARGKYKGLGMGIIAAMPSLAYLLAKMQWGGGDDDYERWKKIPDSTRDKNLIFRTGKESYITIPIPFGFGFFHTLGNTAFALEHGEGLEESSVNVAANFLDHFSPLGNPLTGTKKWADAYKGWTELVPGLGAGDLTRDAARIAANRSSFGSPIVPDSKFDEGRPDHLRMNRNTKGTIYDAAATGLAKLTGGTAATEGNVDISPETLKFWTSVITGGTGTFLSDMTALGGLGARALANPGDADRASLKPEPNEIPIFKDYFKVERVTDQRRAFWDAAKEADSSMKDFKRAQKADDTEGSDRIEKEHGEVMALAGMQQGYGKAVKAMRDDVDEINADKKTSLAYKRAAIKSMEREEGLLYDEFLHTFIGARRSDSAPSPPARR